MTMRDVRDARLIEECAAFHNAYTNYIRGCSVLADLETGGVELPKAETTRRWTSTAWREVIRRISGIPAYTALGLVAKGGVLKGFLAERPANDNDGNELVISILADLAKLLN